MTSPTARRVGAIEEAIRRQGRALADIDDRLRRLEVFYRGARNIRRLEERER